MASFEQKLKALRTKWLLLSLKYLQRVNEINFDIEIQEHGVNYLDFRLFLNPSQRYLQRNLEETRMYLTRLHRERAELEDRLLQQKYEIEAEMILVMHQMKLSDVLKELVSKVESFAPHTPS